MFNSKLTSALTHATLGVSALALVGVGHIAQAEAITLSGTSGNLSASADFAFSGNNLTVTLSNTSTTGVQNPSQLLTGLFFNFNKTLTLTNAVLGPYNPVMGSASKVYTGSTAVASQPTSLAVYKNGNTVTGLTGGWQYKSGVNNSAVTGFNQGVGTAGFNIFDGIATGGTGNQQFNYGIEGTAGLASNANNPTKREKLVKNAIVFSFSGASGLSDADVKQVRFQYGTDINCDPFIVVKPPVKKVPEPTATAALGALALGALGLRKRKMAAKA